MSDWRTDPTYAMCRAVVNGAELSSFADGPFDVRAVAAAVRPEAKDRFLLDEVPWENFPQGDHVREAVRLLRADGSPVPAGVGVVSGMCANDLRAAAALAVAFLIRIAADPHHSHRDAALAEVPAPARARYFGVASRAELLLHRTGSRHDDYGSEVTGYPAGWSVAAAQAAITADAALLLPLLHDPVPATRIRAAYALATVADLDGTVRTALRARFAAEPAPDVCGALLLATAEITRAPHPPTTALLREYWQDHTRAPEVRLAAAIGWLCLTDEAAPDDLRAALDGALSRWLTGWEDPRADHGGRGRPWRACRCRTRGTGIRSR
jgi:hypothetical protein